MANLNWDEDAHVFTHFCFTFNIDRKVGSEREQDFCDRPKLD